MAERGERLMKNALLFMAGGVGSKLVQVFLVPYYTRAMSRGDFGTADLLQLAATLLMPLFSLAAYEGVFRYAMEREQDPRAVFSAGLRICGAGAAALCLCGAALGFWLPRGYLWPVIFYTAAGFFRSLFSQYARAVGKTGLFTLDNVLITACVAALNYWFISRLQWGVQGYLLGYALANLFSCALLCAALGGAGALRPRQGARPPVKALLRYSAPLIPNTVCWWLGSFADRVFIAAMLGSAANGLYAAAHKIPAMLTMLGTLFLQAWQISANAEWKSRDFAAFYSRIFSTLFAAVMLTSSVLMAVCRPVSAVFLGRDFGDAWRYMPVLLLGMSFFTFAQFLGALYAADKRTLPALGTNLLAVAVNLSLNYPLIRLWGVMGAGIATAASYLVLWLARVRSTDRIVRRTRRRGKETAAVLLLGVQAGLTTAGYRSGVLILAALLWLTRADWRRRA